MAIPIPHRVATPARGRAQLHQVTLFVVVAVVTGSVVGARATSLGAKPLAAMMLLVLLAVFGVRSVLPASAFAAMAILPMTLWNFGLPQAYVGIAPFRPSVTSAQAILVAFFAWALAAHAGVVSKVLRAFGPWLIWLAIGWILWWDAPTAPSGTLHLGMGAVALACGATMARLAKARRAVQWAALATVGLQVGVSLLGALGLSFVAFAVSNQTDLAGRAMGTLGHPNQLGKVCVLTIALFLAFLPRASTLVRRLLVMGVLVATVGIALAEARAAAAAAVACLFVWTLLRPSSDGVKSRRGFVLAGVLVIALLSGAAMTERFKEDPHGGARIELTGLALETIRADAVSGLGPNSYVFEVGKHDELTASGVPVHNAFLMLAAETGLPGAFLFFLPLWTRYRKLWRQRALASETGDWARASLALMPALVILGLTGWGLWLGGTYLLTMLVIGFLGSGADSSLEGNLEGAA